MTRFVLDCSVTVAWCFHDHADAYTWSVLARLPKAYAVVPAVWPVEIANALVVAERRKLIQKSDSAKFLAMLEGFQFSVDPETGERAWGPILALARDQRLSAYDAAYLELALRRRLPLATRDEGLKRAASALAVDLL